MGVLDRIEGTTAATHIVSLCLDAGLKGEWDQEQSKLEEAAKKDAQFGSLEMEHTVAVVESMDALRDRMSASMVDFEFSALPWDKRLAMQAQHPPREGNLLDQAKGHNVETFGPELIKATCLSVTDADGDRVEEIPEETWAKLFGRLNFAQFNELYSGAAQTSDVSPTVPPSARFLLGSQDSGASSTRPGPGTSRRGGSAGGNRRTSRSSSTAKKAAAKAASSA